jgi:NHL repeat-containing protein
MGRTEESKVRRHAKATSAGSTQRRAGSLGSRIRGALAVPGASLNANGSGAPSRARASALALAIAALTLLAFAPLSQAKVLVNGFGIPTLNPQAFGGQMAPGFLQETRPRGVAVNTSGIGAPAGTAYVVDDKGHRVQRFSPLGDFQRLWGQDVIATSVNEQQRLTIDAEGGTFTLTFKGDTTDPIVFDGSTSTAIGLTGAAIDNALDALPAVGADANVNVSGNQNDGPIFFITFSGALAAADQPQLSVNIGELNGTAEVVTLADGTATTASTGTGFEICTVATQCQAGSTSGATANGGQLNNPQGVAVNQSNGHLYVTENGNSRVSEFDADGNFVRAWGWDVISSGKPNDNGTGFEICDTQAATPNSIADCKQGLSSTNGGGGQLGSSIGHPITDSSNNVWVPDATNRRIQKFGPTGAFIAAYGHNVDALGGGGALETCTSTAPGACQAGTQGSGAGQFSAANPTQIAFDSTANLYAIDAGNRRVQRFDPAFTTASTFGASTFPTYTTTAPQRLTALAGGTRLAFALTNNVSGGGESQIIELDSADASVKDTSLVGAGILQEVGGLGADATKLYATVGFGFISGIRNSGPRQVLVLGDTPPPAPTIALKPVSVKTDTTAVFEATVDPRGGLLTCKFQYSTDQSNWTDVPDPGCDSLAPGGGVQAISQGVTGLTPNTTYFFRLQVSRPLLANSTVTSFVRVFATDSVPPVVTNVGAIQVTDVSARLVGTIDPRNNPTGYVFEYGTTPALGTSTAPVNIGGGTEAITVSQVVGGLTPDTDYYFRLVATNAFGSTPSDQRTFHTRTDPIPPANPGNCSNEALRQAQSSEFLPDCRAYEMVSPPDKNQGSVGSNSELKAGFSRDGEAVAFCSRSLFGDPPPQMTFICGAYLSRRGPEGWRTSSPFPPFCRIDYDSGTGGEFHAFLSPGSFERVAIDLPEFASCPIPPLDPAAPPGVNLYREDLTTDPFSFDLLTPAPTVAGSGQSINAGQFAAGNEDFSHIVYMSRGRQTPDSPEGDNFNKLYDWEEEGYGGCATPGGCLSLLSVDPSGTAFTTPSKLPGSNLGAATPPLASAISADGERVYFQNAADNSDFPAGNCSDAACDLYLREGGTTTFHVSASECTVNCGGDGSPALFRWANLSGDIALLVSCSKLTDASAEARSCEIGLSTPTASQQLKLYRWDHSAPPGNRLVDLSLDNEPADGSQPGAVDLIGASEDGDVVYFVAGGQIVSGAPTGRISGTSLKLYRWRWNGGSPSVEYLAPYLSVWSNGTTVNDGDLSEDPNANRLHVRVTPDGRYLLIQTKLALDPAGDRDSDADLYRWDEQGGWLCVSCQLPGAPSAGHVSAFEAFFPDNGLTRDLVSHEPEHTISDDGQRVFFTTPDALVPEDVNGETGCPVLSTNFSGRTYTCQDVYEWHDGTVSLITPGTGSDPFLLIGATAGGEDVFFATPQRLVGWDIDNNMDIYTAHAGGGFPEPPPVPPGCDLDAGACEGPGTTAAAIAGAGSAAFQGPPNPTPPRPRVCPKGKRRVVRNGRTRCVKRAKRRAANHNRRAAR